MRPIWWGLLTQIRHSSRKSSAIHSYWCVQYFHVSKQWYSSQRSGYLTCTQMLIYTIKHGGCTDTVRESALKVDCEEKRKKKKKKSLAAPGTRTRLSIAPSFSVGRASNLVSHRGIKSANLVIVHSHRRIKSVNLLIVTIRAQELCDSRGGRPGFSVP